MLFAWKYIAYAVVVAAISAISLRACSLDRDNAVLKSQMEREEKCAKASYCESALTAYERDTAQKATTAISDAVANAGKAADRLDTALIKIETSAQADKERYEARLRATQRKFEEAAATDKSCQDWLKMPIACPVTDPGGVLFAPTETRGVIDRSGVAADDGVSEDPARANGTAVPGPGPGSDGRPNE
jgi:hypothetical protein